VLTNNALFERDEERGGNWWDYMLFVPHPGFPTEYKCIGKIKAGPNNGWCSPYDSMISMV